MEPADRTIDSPAFAPEAELPTTILMDPPRPDVLAPVANTTVPELPVYAVPVEINIAPEMPPLNTLALEIVTLPVPDDALLPVATLTSPPTAAPHDRPDFNVTDPPVTLEPATTLMAPAVPAVAPPVPNTIAPTPPLFVVPVDRYNDPDNPAEATFGVWIMTKPDPDDVLDPVTMDTDPPIAPLTGRPADSRTVPPTPAAT